MGFGRVEAYISKIQNVDGYETHAKIYEALGKPLLAMADRGKAARLKSL